jgi:hypothetical protein
MEVEGRQDGSGTGDWSLLGSGFPPSCIDGEWIFTDEGINERQQAGLFTAQAACID